MADAAVVEKTSGAPGGGPMLKGDNLEKFAAAVGGQPVDDAAPASSEAAAPSEPTPEESAPVDEAPAPESTPTPKPAAPRPAAPEDNKGPIPYTRFTEVNEQLKAERQKVQDYERTLQQRVTEAANAQSATTLFKIAEEHPELAPLIFRGEKPAPKAPQRDPNAPPLTTEQQALEEIKTQNKALMNWKEQTEKAQTLQKIQDRAEAQIEKHQIFTNPTVRDLAEQLIVKEILTKPHVSVEVIVDNIAKGFSDLEASIKSQYLEKKKTTAKTVVPGVGSGGPPAPPAQPPRKLKLQDGSALKAMHAALSGMNSES